MRDDDLLKDVFRRAAHGEPSSGDAFGRFERIQRRTALTRFFTVATVAIASAILLARLLPGASQGEERDVFIPGGQDLSEPQASNRYTDPIARFRINYPLDWIGRGDVGRFAEIFPQVGLQAGELKTTSDRRLKCGTACGPFGSRYVTDTAEQFYISIEALRPDCRDQQPGCSRLANGKALDAELRKAGAKIARGRASVAGRDVARVETSFPRRPDPIVTGKTELPPHYWCSGCRTRELLIPWEGGLTLYLRIVSPNADDFVKFNQHISFALDTLAVFAPPSGS